MTDRDAFHSWGIYPTNISDEALVKSLAYTSEKWRLGNPHLQPYWDHMINEIKLNRPHLMHHLVPLKLTGEIQ